MVRYQTTGNIGILKEYLHTKQDGMPRCYRTTILSLLLLLAYRPLKSELTVCPTSNGYVHDVTSGLCVILLPDWVERDKAKEQCEGRGDRLLWLDTALKETFFRDFARTDGDSFWLGGYKTGPSSWGWSDNDQLCHTSWSPDQPDGTGNCMAIANWYDWLWDDVHCNQHMRIACERLTVTTVRGCGQLNTSTPTVLSTTAPADAATSPTEETRSEVTETAVTRTNHISETSESTDDVMHVSTAPPATTFSANQVDSNIGRLSTDITPGESPSIALSSTTVTTPETLDASSTNLGIWDSEIVLTPTYTRVFSAESDGYTVETDDFEMPSSYVIDSLESSAYIGESSGFTTDTNVHTKTSSIVSSIQVTASSSSILDSGVHTRRLSSSATDSSVQITTTSSSEIDSSVQITAASSSTIDTDVQIIQSSSFTTESSAYITVSSEYVVSTSSGSILKTNSDNVFPITNDTGKTNFASTTSVISDFPNLLKNMTALPSPTQTTVTTSPTTAPCRCFCEPKHRYNALRLDDLQQRKEDVRESLLLDKRGLSKFEARYTSADDQRPSSFTIASVGMSLIVACGFFIIFSDVINLVRAQTKKTTHK